MIKYGKKIYGIEAAVPALVDLLSRKADVQAVYMFGSRAAGTAKDIFLILGDEGILPAVFHNRS